MLGTQYRFSEFLSLSLSQPPAELPKTEQDRLQEISDRFARYPDLTEIERRHLVANARRVLMHSQRLVETKAEAQSDRSNHRVKEQILRTTPLADANRHVELDQAVTFLPGIGPKNNEKLAKLGLFTVRDLLYYYPRDHIDYARQVDIREAKPGETVTLVAVVKRCTCFNSPRNP
ncbi:MAG: DNA helicase RecG, partial [Microcoleus sp. SIO2G3]|nr:DNA helicase RecG [Microcoleus sp. SIO2G3]